MLAEWFQYLTTPCPGFLRALGYPQQIIATQARYRRCKKAWRPHLEHTKSVILESALESTGTKRAVILGSGSLLDIPLAGLSHRFDQVELVDILHLPWVKRHALRYPNVRFHTLDVTGVCQPFFDQVAHLNPSGNGAADPVEPRLPQAYPKPLSQSLNFGQVDFLASVNLLSQLPMMPMAFLEKRGQPHCSDEGMSFSRALITNHLLWIKASSERTCLITDLERRVCNLSGEEMVREDALYGVALSEPDREWIWDIAPHPEINSHQDFRHRVGGFLNLH